MLYVRSVAVFAVERPNSLNYFEGVRIINTINVFVCLFLNPVNDSKIFDVVQFISLD